MDPETEFLMSKQETGNEWELFKENVRPLKRGRNVNLLNHALKSHSHSLPKQSLLDTRKRLIEAIDEYQGDDPLLPWIECIKWVQESFPPGGDSSGLIVMYEQCVRTFWHSKRYKDDLRYLKVWLEYAENCVDAGVIFDFLDANEIGKSHSEYYIAHALHCESKSKMKAANEVFNLGISRNAQPIEKLKDAYKNFITRSMRKHKVEEENSGENHLPMRSFGTLLSNAGNRSQSLGSSDARKKLQSERAQKSSFTVYKDTNDDMLLGHQAGKTVSSPWQTLGPRAERNKENNAIPAKWTTFKVPYRPGPRAGVAPPSTSIKVFVDEECEQRETEKQDGNMKSCTLQLRQGKDIDIKKETELLRENPLRNFPSSSLPR